MCIHLRFVIRLPIATEADTFDVETQALDLAVAYHCQLVMESVFTKKHNKTCLRRAQIRYRYKGTPAESHARLLVLTFVSLCKLANREMFSMPHLRWQQAQEVTALKRTKGLPERKKNTHITVQFVTNGYSYVFFFCLMTKPAFSQSLPVSS